MDIQPVQRKATKKIWVGDVPVGGGSPISVQSMTNTETLDVSATVNQINKLEEAGADIIVVGSHGRHGLALLLGSTANGVLHGASCDVLAVRVGHDDSEST